MSQTKTSSFRTKLALLWMNLSSEPLTAIYTLIPFILRKELGATTYQIALFATLSPVLSVLSFYWGAWLTHRKNKLLPNLIGAWILARLPFLFFPLMTNFWIVLVCCGIYQLFSRASTPALMEILKRTIPKKPREYAFSFYFILSVIEGAFIGFVLSKVLHADPGNWKILFLLSALVSLTSVLIQLFIRVPKDAELSLEPPKNRIIQPIKESFKLMSTRPDFARFQWGFMVGGFALMLMAPARAIFSTDYLPLTLADMTIARCVFVGIGLAGSSLLWTKALEIFGIHRLIPWVIFGFGFFSLTLLLSPVHIGWFYAAHFIYGVAQGGSHLIWHLSGPIFAGDQNSTPFTTVNVLMIGLRGAIGPFLGGFLCNHLGPFPVLVTGSLIALFGAYMMWQWKLRSATTSIET